MTSCLDLHPGGLYVCVQVSSVDCVDVLLECYAHASSSEISVLAEDGVGVREQFVGEHCGVKLSFLKHEYIWILTVNELH